MCQHYETKAAARAASAVQGASLGAHLARMITEMSREIQLLLEPLAREEEKLYSELDELRQAVAAWSHVIDLRAMPRADWLGLGALDAASCTPDRVRRVVLSLVSRVDDLQLALTRSDESLQDERLRLAEALQQSEAALTAHHAAELAAVRAMHETRLRAAEMRLADATQQANASAREAAAYVARLEAENERLAAACDASRRELDDLTGVVRALELELGSTGMRPNPLLAPSPSRASRARGGEGASSFRQGTAVVASAASTDAVAPAREDDEARRGRRLSVSLLRDPQASLATGGSAGGGRAGVPPAAAAASPELAAAQSAMDVTLSRARARFDALQRSQVAADEAPLRWQAPAPQLHFAGAAAVVVAAPQPQPQQPQPQPEIRAPSPAVPAAPAASAASTGARTSPASERSGTSARDEGLIARAKRLREGYDRLASSSVRGAGARDDFRRWPFD